MSDDQLRLHCHACSEDNVAGPQGLVCTACGSEVVEIITAEQMQEPLPAPAPGPGPGPAFEAPAPAEKWERPDFAPAENEAPDAPTMLPYAEMFSRLQAAYEGQEEAFAGRGELEYSDVLQRIQLKGVQAGRGKVDPQTGFIAMPTESGQVYVLDPEKFAGQGSVTIDKESSDVAVIPNLNHPRGVSWLNSLDDGTLVLACGENGGHAVSIHHLDPSLEEEAVFVRRFGGPDHSDRDDMFYYVQDIHRIEIDGKELLAVADGPNDRIKVIDPLDNSLFSKAECRWPWGLSTNDKTVFATLGKEIVTFDAVTGETLETVVDNASASTCAVDSLGNLMYSNDEELIVQTPGRERICATRYKGPLGDSIVGLDMDGNHGRVLVTHNSATSGDHTTFTILQANVMIKAARKK